MNDKFSVSAMFRCRRFSDAEIEHYCGVLAESGARHLVLDAETLHEVLDHQERCKDGLYKGQKWYGPNRSRRY